MLSSKQAKREGKKKKKKREVILNFGIAEAEMKLARGRLGRDGCA